MMMMNELPSGTGGNCDDGRWTEEPRLNAKASRANRRCGCDNHTSRDGERHPCDGRRSRSGTRHDVLRLVVLKKRESAD